MVRYYVINRKIKKVMSNPHKWTKVQHKYNKELECSKSNIDFELFL